MDDAEAWSAIGQLIGKAQREKFPSRRQFSIATSLDIKTLTAAEKGMRELHSNTQSEIEKALGWRKGSIDEVWTRRGDITAESLTVQQMHEQNNHATPFSASDLTDKELLDELALRLSSPQKVRKKSANAQQQAITDSGKNP